MARKQDLIDVLNRLTSEELGECIAPCGELTQYLISVTESYYAKKNELSPKISQSIIRLFLAVSEEIGGEMVYMPYTPSKADHFAAMLASFVLDGTFSVDSIRKFGGIKNYNASSKRAYLWLERIEVIVDVIRHETKLLTVCDKTKYNIVFAFFSGFLLSLSGRAQYFPRACSLVNMLKRKGICMDFTGNNIYPLARKYKISATMIYFYLKEYREKTRKTGNEK